MTCDKYILDEKGRPVPEPDLYKWGMWFESANRSVADEIVNGARVSTVFLGLNHNYGEGEPLLWETMVFGGDLDQEQDRCSGGREQAEAMHQQMKQRVIKETNWLRGKLRNAARSLRWRRK